MAWLFQEMAGLRDQEGIGRYYAFGFEPRHFAFEASEYCWIVFQDMK
jgi:hypothetical protein